jgi:hypothetical protein
MMPPKAPSLFRNGAFGDLEVEVLTAYLNLIGQVQRLRDTVT